MTRAVTALDQSIAIAFLVRGADEHWREGVARLALAMRSCPPGGSVAFYALFKGFASSNDRDEAASRLAGLTDHSIDLADDAFDIGAYHAAAEQIVERRICFLNGYSEPLSPGWLEKMSANLTTETVGAVGATASFESLRSADRRFPAFPNPHLRSNAFLVERTLFLDLASQFEFRSKRDAFGFESGRHSFSARLKDRGLNTLVVGRDGRGYEPRFWPLSQTFRLGEQSNLLVGDNQTRAFDSMPWAEKRDAVLRTWGPYADPSRHRLQR